jgi:hypothetical protein
VHTGLTPWLNTRMQSDRLWREIVPILSLAYAARLGGG